MSSRRIYLIDGVQVSFMIYKRRQLFGEHKEARFQIVDIRAPKEYTR